ncbi:MAG TPA: hypothetical protein VGN34_25970, partial [Ktedonobacteraceae bacterium]
SGNPAQLYVLSHLTYTLNPLSGPLSSIETVCENTVKSGQIERFPSPFPRVVSPPILKELS